MILGLGEILPSTSRRRSTTAANAALIAILPVLRLPSLQQSSGFNSPSSISPHMFSQSLHLAQLELEQLLQPDRHHLLGKMEAIDTGDIWEPLG